VITKDNVVVEIDALIYSQITDPVRATYEIANLPDAIEKLTQTTLRNVIGEMELDHVLSSRDTITPSCARSWTRRPTRGAKVSRVELKDINPPRDIGTRWRSRCAPSGIGAPRSSPLRPRSSAHPPVGRHRQSEINQAEGQKQARTSQPERRPTPASRSRGGSSGDRRITTAIKGTGGDPARY